MQVCCQLYFNSIYSNSIFFSSLHFNILEASVTLVGMMWALDGCLWCFLWISLAYLPVSISNVQIPSLVVLQLSSSYLQLSKSMIMLSKLLTKPMANIFQCLWPTATIYSYASSLSTRYVFSLLPTHPCNANLILLIFLLLFPV